MFARQLILTFSLPAIILFTSISSLLAQELDQNATNDDDCPTWYVPAQDENGKCVCGDHNDNVYCISVDHQVNLTPLHCMTYTDEQVLFSDCPYIANSSTLNTTRTILPKNVSELNEFMCGGRNRTGLLCSQCRDNLTLAALSYTRECVECSDADVTKGIILYVVFAFIPTTAFFLLVMMCGINISSGPMNAMLIIIHINLAQINRAMPSYVLAFSPGYRFVTSVLLTIYGIWNLDFLRYVVPPFCISESLTSLQAQLLEYAIVVYPFLVITLTYIFVELYDRGNCLIVRLWRPFRNASCFKNFDTKYSLSNAFATFLLLNYTKIFLTSVEILHYVHVKNVTGDTVSTVLYIDASITYFSSTHIPYAILAIVVMAIFNVLPLLLLLYPRKWSPKCFPNCQSLQAFMDIFQGCYKNGTDGTGDFRFFAALNFVVRIIVVYQSDLLTERLILVFLIFSYMLLSMRPYQRNIFNFFDSFVFILYASVALYKFLDDDYLFFDIAYYLSHVILILFIGPLVLSKAVKVLFPAFYAQCSEKAEMCIEMLKEGKFSLCGCLKTKLKDIEGGRVDDDSHQCEDVADYRSPLLPSQTCSSTHSTKHIIIASYGIVNNGND